ncbi:MAG: phage holin family protein, partial [Candidatus Promineifilaceae bacterium]
MRNLIQSLVRLLIMTVVEGLSLLLMAWIIPGISIITDTSSNVLTEAVSIAIVLAILNGLVRPILVLLTLPISIFTLGLFTLVINALMLLLASAFLPFFEVNGFWAALGGSVILSAVNTVITGLITIDDDNSFYDGVVQWLSRRRLEAKESDLGRGIVMLEIDGLSYQRMKRALEDGFMPTAKRLLETSSHGLSHVDCGLPSQTSACQAGIMYGDNYDIPAFRWYDKKQGRLYVSNNFRDAAEINGRYSNGQGLLRDGTSINNLMAGDASKAILTMSMLVEGPDEVDRRSPGDMYLVFVNPYFFTRALVLTIWDIVVELFQGARQRIRNAWPRINRLEKAYPLLRGVTNVFMRDVSTYTVILDVIRGTPAIYTTYVGYDEVAHHAGPDTKDAMDTLRGIDKQLGRILEVIERKAPRPYDVFVLSDHGQSYGATFRQRYGQTLSEYLETLLGSEARVAEVDATENAQGHANVLLAEISNMQGKQRVGRVTDAALGQAARTLEQQIQPLEIPPALMDSAVIACVSGNLANVYFDLHAGRVDQVEL